MHDRMTFTNMWDEMARLWLPSESNQPEPHKDDDSHSKEESERRHGGVSRMRVPNSAEMKSNTSGIDG